ncbi:MAG: thermonuclease family protein [Anaerolineales bacterium]
MNETPEPGWISRFKWPILGGCGLIIFFLCGSFLLFLPDILSNPKVRQSSEALFAAIPTNIVAVEDLDLSTSAVDVTPTAQPLETDDGLPNREVVYVIQVIDGDTIEVFLNEKAYRLRYIGIDSPEIGMPGSEEATEANRDLVSGQILELESDISNTDQHGRLLRYVYLSNGTLVNAELVALGYAVAVAYPPDIKYQEMFEAKQLEAQENGLGLWITPTAAATLVSEEYAAIVVIDPACSQFNAPGNDNENKNEEYVCLVSQSIELVEMTGWIVRDEYGWTYSIPEFTLEPGTAVKVRSGCGDNSQKDLYWCKDETAVWNNDGDCVYLISKEGKTIAQYCY